MPGKASARSIHTQKETAKNRKMAPSAMRSSFAPQGSTSMAAVQQALAEPHKVRAADILALQRLSGNRAVAQLLSSHALQAKLSVGAAHDIYEQEADRVAAQVVAAPVSNSAVQRFEEGGIQAKPLASVITPLLQRDAVPEEEELQARSNVEGESFAPGADFENRLAAARAGGVSLPHPTREFMEQRIGADFSGVKVHTDAQSAQLSQSIQAKAFTTGQDVFFGEGAYQPGSQSGRELIAHELTHVVQQTGRVQRHPHDPAQLDHGHYASNSEKTYTVRSADDLIAKLREQLRIFKGADSTGRRFDTGFNGQGRGDNNEVVTLKTLETVLAGWKDLAVEVLGVPRHRAREAYSATEGQKTGKRMHDFLVEGSDNKVVFNFHIEVEGRAT